MRIPLFICLIVVLMMSGCSSSSYEKYPDEVKQAYEYVHPNSQKTIKNWKKAKVEEYTPTEDLEISNKDADKFINIKGISTIKVTFKTNNEDTLGPITVYIDKNSNKVLGIAIRKSHLFY